MSGISIKNICCMCLSTDRKLYTLYKVLDGINLLYMLLAHDPEAYKEGFYKNSASLIICWECRAVICKIKRFQMQVCATQKLLTSLVNGRNEVKLETFSRLKTVHNKTQYEIQSDSVTENFIDCGSAKDLKDESDSDELPLSAFCFNNYNIETSNDINDTLIKNGDMNNVLPDTNNVIPDDSKIIPDGSKIVLENSNSETKLTRKKKAKMKYKEYISMTTMNENKMVECMEERRNGLVKEKFKCFNCILIFKTENKLLEHNRKMHLKTDNKSKCDLCMTYVSDLHTHRQTHYHIYNCVLCAHVSYTERDMVKHFKKDHPEIWSGNTMTSKRKFTKTNIEPKYPCPECNMTFLNKDLRWKHTQKAHREGFRCSVCDKTFAFRNNLERHERIHKGPLPREECATCHKMIRIDLLKVHSRIHTDRQTYSCVECDKRFVSRETYESHLKYAGAHATVEVCRHKCGICDKRYRSRGELRDHVNYQHNGRTEHKCPICNKGLATKRCIRRHVRRAHEGIKESAKDKICQQCGKAFRDNKSLIEHERVHSGVRPLACACGRRFRQRAALAAHQARHKPT